MSTRSGPRPAKRLRDIVGTVFVAAVLTSTVGMPMASAEPESNLGALIDHLHIKDGCESYGGSDDLFQTAVQIAQSMAAYGGNHGAPGTLAPTTEQLLSGRGYTANGLGEMDWYSPTRVNNRNAYYFWRDNGTRALFKECGLQQMAVAEWIVDGHMAAVALMATPA